MEKFITLNHLKMAVQSLLLKLNNEISTLSPVAKTGSYNDLIDKPETSTIQEETDPYFFSSPASSISNADIIDWNNKLSSYTETDPTVPAWAKQATKPTYTASEVGAAATDHTHTQINLANSMGDGKVSVNINEVLLTASTNGGSTLNTMTLTGTSTTIHNIVTPTANGDAANKKYVDDAVAAATPTETDPVFSASAAADITSTDITDWNSKSTVQIVRW